MWCYTELLGLFNASFPVAEEMDAWDFADWKKTEKYVATAIPWKICYRIYIYILYLSNL